MSLRQLRARLERLEARFPADEESIARARYDVLHRKFTCNEPLTEAEKSEHSELQSSVIPHLPPATTDEERAARARWNDLRRRARGRSEPLTEAEEEEFHELSFRYHFMGPQLKVMREHDKKSRAEEEERSRLRQLERQKKAAAAARMSAEADSSDCPDGTGAKKTSRFVGRKREAAAPVQVSYEDESDWRPIDDDDF
jgi:hypothetical protein